MSRFHRDTDSMTLDQVDAELGRLAAKPVGQLTPRDADRMRELRLARSRIVGRDLDYSWWR